MADIEGQKMPCNGQSDRIDCITMGADPTPSGRRKDSMHWLLVICSVLAYLTGNSSAILLSRFYFQQGGNSRWIQTLSQCMGWPLLLLPMLVKRHGQPFISSNLTTKFFLICGGLGVLTAVDIMFYSWGVSFLPASTFSLLCATQLAFAVLFAFILVRHKITGYVMNAVVLLTLSAIMLGVHDHSRRPEGVTSEQFVLGFVFTIVGSALFGLCLPLMQLVFKYVVGKETFAVVVETQACINMVASVVSVIGLLASGDFRKMKDEAHSFRSGMVSYYMTIVWNAIGCQIALLGAFGMTFMVSSLFANIICTVSLPVASILAVIFFKDNMDAIKIISILLGLWALVSYVFGAHRNSKVSTSRTGSQSRVN